jgi:hypothetical protein
MDGQGSEAVWEDMELRAEQAAAYVDQARRRVAVLRGLDWRSPAGMAFLRQLEAVALELGGIDGDVEDARRDVALGRARASALRRLGDAAARGGA